MAGKGKFNTEIILRLLVGILFVCIGIEGIAGLGSDTGLYRDLDDLYAILLGVVIMLAGLLLVVPMFIKGIPTTFTKVSMGVILIVWVAVIILSDFVYGVKHTSGKEWFSWVETFIYHLLILSCVVNVSLPAIKGAAKKAATKA